MWSMCISPPSLLYLLQYSWCCTWHGMNFKLKFSTLECPEAQQKRGNPRIHFNIPTDPIEMAKWRRRRTDSNAKVDRICFPSADVDAVSTVKSSIEPTHQSASLQVNALRVHEKNLKKIVKALQLLCTKPKLNLWQTITTAINEPSLLSPSVHVIPHQGTDARPPPGIYFPWLLITF